jgi:hypothetical protein
VQLRAQVLDDDAEILEMDRLAFSMIPMTGTGLAEDRGATAPVPVMGAVSAAAWAHLAPAYGTIFR